MNINRTAALRLGASFLVFISLASIAAIFEDNPLTRKNITYKKTKKSVSKTSSINVSDESVERGDEVKLKEDVSNSIETRSQVILFYCYNQLFLVRIRRSHPRLIF